MVVVRPGPLRAQLARTLRTAYADGLMSESTFSYRLDQLLSRLGLRFCGSFPYYIWKHGWSVLPFVRFRAFYAEGPILPQFCYLLQGIE